jgi:hypothetical protein
VRIKSPDAAAKADEAAPTLKVKMPAGAPQAEATPASKKRETSRIPLGAAVPPGSEEKKPATIRIRPAVESKRKTSRISLEAALAVQDEPADASKPKTIRLKRPDEMPTVKVKTKPGLAKPEVTPPSASAPGDELSATRELDVGEEEGSSPTRKKTIVVKRPQQRPSVRGVTIKQGGAGQPEAVPGQVEAVATDQAHWMFHTCGIAAILAMGVLIYVLCAQVFGPDISLTQLSYGAKNTELPWPGRFYTRPM